MAYHTAEYRREEDRDNTTGGWRSWFGLGDKKDRDEDRGYSYSNTTTYRNPNPSYGYSSAPQPERSGFSGPAIGSRGGYGYTASDEVTRGPSWDNNRDYTTRAGYGTTGDREVSYKQETRTYGGDRDNWTTSRPYTPSRPTEYPTSRWSEYPTSSRYPTTEYPTSRYPTTEYPTSRYQSTEYPTTSRPYGFSADRDVTSRDYPSRTSAATNFGYTAEHPSRSWPVTGDRDNTTSRYQSTEYPTSRPYGFSADRETTSRDYPTTGRSYGSESRPYPTGGDRDYSRTSYSTRY